jgi:hypothetical protein
MIRARACAVLALIMAFQFPSALAASGADVQVTLQPRHGTPRFPGPPFTGNVEVFDKVVFDFTVHNNGPAPTDVTFSLRTSFGSRRYNSWTVPMRQLEGWNQGTANTCNAHLTCHFHLKPGSSFEIRDWLEGNAPGPFLISAHVAASVSDPDSSNNTASYHTRVRCSIEGGPGNDILKGTSARDSICGFGGNDGLVAVGKGDALFSGAGNDVLVSDGGSHTLVGGSGIDTVSYANAPRGVRVFLNAKTMYGWGDQTLVAIENVIGSRHDDIIWGSQAPNVLMGEGGSDAMIGVGGHDDLFGGRGDDEFCSKNGVVDHLNGGPGVDRAQADSQDVVVSAERVGGSPFPRCHR